MRAMRTYRVAVIGEDGAQELERVGDHPSRGDAISDWLRVMWGEGAIFERDEDTTGIYGRICRRVRKLSGHRDEPLTDWVRLVVEEVE